VASFDAPSTTVWAMHVYFPPWRSWAFRIVRSPTVSFCTWGTARGKGSEEVALTSAVGHKTQTYVSGVSCTMMFVGHSASQFSYPMAGTSYTSLDTTGD
jgi:hypothetical protein